MCGLGFNFVIVSGSFHKLIQMFHMYFYALLSQMCLGQWIPLEAALLEAKEVDLQTLVRCQRYTPEAVGAMNQLHHKTSFSFAVFSFLILILIFLPI